MAPSMIYEAERVGDKTFYQNIIYIGSLRKGEGGGKGNSPSIVPIKALS